MAKWRLRIASWILKATNSHSEYVLLNAFPPQQWLHESASLLLYTYNTLSVLFNPNQSLYACHYVRYQYFSKLPTDGRTDWTKHLSTAVGRYHQPMVTAISSHSCTQFIKFPFLQPMFPVAQIKETTRQDACSRQQLDSFPQLLSSHSAALLSLTQTSLWRIRHRYSKGNFVSRSRIQVRVA